MRKIFIAVFIIIGLIGSAGLIFAEEKNKVEIAAPGAAEPAKSAALAPAAPAAPAPPKIDTGDTAWMLTSAALVLLMTPGSGSFLWRNGSVEECVGYDHAQFHYHCHRQYAMGSLGVQSGFRS